MSRAPSSTANRRQRLDDEAEIRGLIENWIIWRDSGDFDRFANLWHPDGWMVATWFQASAADFIARSKQAFARGMKGVHILGGTSVEVARPRAIAQTRMQILQRAAVHDVEVDVACHGRFFDFLQQHDGEWKLVHRQPIYELDHLSPLDPNASLTLDPELLAAFPDGYKHLGYVQSKMGFDVARNLPGTRGPEVEALMARGRQWLCGEAVDLRAPLV